MSNMKHLLLGEKMEYDKLSTKQKEAYNLQKVSSIFAEYGWLVIKLSADWNGADFIALEFGTDRYLKVQLKDRFGFYRKVRDQNAYILIGVAGIPDWRYHTLLLFDLEMLVNILKYERCYDYSEEELEVVERIKAWESMPGHKKRLTGND